MGRAEGKRKNRENGEGTSLEDLVACINGCLFISLHVATILVLFLFKIDTLNFDLEKKTDNDKCLKKFKQCNSF